MNESLYLPQIAYASRCLAALGELFETPQIADEALDDVVDEIVDEVADLADHP